jgi:CheY-like chemotaxis protein
METHALTHKSNAEPARPSRGYVLIVDDEEQNRQLLRDPLEVHGYEIAEAPNGKEAARMVAERAPDLILLDVMMPEMDGFEFCRHMKKNNLTPPIPILMVTALSERQERLMGIAAGASDFLSKPVDLHDLRLRVGNAVHAKRLNDQVQKEQALAERMLLNVLPKPIAERLKNGETCIADHHPEVTVLLANLVGFNKLSALISPAEVVSLLNEIYSAFDLLVEKHGVEKIKSFGDSYLVASGLPFPQSDHAESLAELALDMRAEVERLNQQYNTSICLRIGISTGPVLAGVIGRSKFSYDLWGETVNLACVLEAQGEPGTIQVATPTYDLLQSRYQFEKIQVVDPAGQNQVSAYRLQARR